MSEACCTCASILTYVYDEKSEKPQIGRRLECCQRAVCARCLNNNPRFANYCPFCQISTGPSVLPAQGLREPPTYSPPNSAPGIDELPPYSAHNHIQPPLEKGKAANEPAPDVLHFVDPNNDTISSLSIRYGVPVDALRRTNKLFTDHLLAARRTILIPGEYYQGESLSPRPVEGEEDELKKTKLRKFMVTCKVVDYDVALLYLDQGSYNLNDAILAYQTDEQWEKEHSLEDAKKGKSKASGRRNWGFGGLTGQLS